MTYLSFVIIAEQRLAMTYLQALFLLAAVVPTSVQANGRVVRAHPYACEESPCKNNGTCVETGDNVYAAFRCECPFGFVGVLCEYAACWNAEPKCENNGTCEKLTDTGVCVCDPNFSGDKCEYKVFRYGWDQDISPFKTYGSIDFHPNGGQDETDNYGRITHGENFTMALYNVGASYNGHDFCARFWYKLSDKGAVLNVYVIREQLVPHMPRYAWSSEDKVTEYGVWKEARVNVHGIGWTSFKISGSTSPTTKELGLDQIVVQRTSCDNLKL